MSLNDWSERIVIAELGDEPAFSDDMDALLARYDGEPHHQNPHDARVSRAGNAAADAGVSPSGGADVILNFRRVSYLNSSNLAQLLRLRKKLSERDRRLRLCCVEDSVWSVLLTTGLDTVFTFNEDVATALASLQMKSGNA